VPKNTDHTNEATELAIERTGPIINKRRVVGRISAPD
jgi:hypothetical protein